MAFDDLAQSLNCSHDGKSKECFLALDLNVLLKRLFKEFQVSYTEILRP